MLLQHRRTFATVIWTFDIAMLCTAAYVGALDAWGQPPSLWHTALQSGVIAVAWSNLAHRYDLYQSRRTSSLLSEFLALAQVILLASGVAWLLRGLFGQGAPDHAQTSLAIAFSGTFASRACAVKRTCTASRGG